MGITFFYQNPLVTPPWNAELFGLTASKENHLRSRITASLLVDDKSSWWWDLAMWWMLCKLTCINSARFLIFHIRSANDFIQISTSQELRFTSSKRLQVKRPIWQIRIQCYSLTLYMISNSSTPGSQRPPPSSPQCRRARKVRRAIYLVL